MLTIINFVPKIQALDKSAATLAEIRAQIPRTKVMSIIGLSEKNRSERIDSLVDLLAEVSDEVAFVGNHPSFAEAYDFLRLGGKSVVRVIPRDLVGHVERFVSPESRTLFFSPVGKGIGEIGDLLVAWAKSKRVPVVGYFKSLHDQGAGFSTPLVSDLSLNSLLNRFRKTASRLSRERLVVRGVTADELKARNTDLLMVFNEHHRKILAGQVGFTRVVESGYPLLYPRWRDLVAKSSFCRGFVREASLEVVVFTRGETPGRRPEDNVVNNSNLRILLEHIISALDQTGKHWRIRIKPHPIQDLKILEQFVFGRAGVEIVSEAPGLLAKTSDLVIATYSSTVVDSLAVGVPAIEYFFETPFFRKKHPGGSPFPQFGAIKARNREELLSALAEANLNPTPTGGLKALSIRPDFGFLLDGTQGRQQEI